MVYFEVMYFKMVCFKLVYFDPLLFPQIIQTDEEQLGMTYKELSVIGRLRKINATGPYSMFCKLVHLWKEVYTPKQVSQGIRNTTGPYSMFCKLVHLWK